MSRNSSVLHFPAVLVVMAAVSLAACGGSMSTSTNPGGTPTPTPTPSASSIDVTTYHYDNFRTGENINETTLTTANVNQTKFGKLGELMVDGKVDAQPLYLSNLSISGGTKNVLYVATEHGSVFAFDADNVSGTAAVPLWKSSTLQTGEVPSDDRGCGQVTPEIGITSTPVIDRTRGAIYVVSVSKNSATGNYVHRIHALDLTSGKELFGGPTTVTATFPGSGAGSVSGVITFDPREYNERPGLLELNGTIYTTWGSHCDAGPYTSWMMAYSADTLKQTSVLNLVPNGSDGGIWMSGGAPAADAAGSIYFIIGNGTFDTVLNANGLPSQGDCGNCYVRVSSTLPLTLLDLFTPLNTVTESGGDVDFGSGGPLLLPDVIDGSGKVRHLAVGSGKDANIYVLDRDSMGKFSAVQDNIYQLISGQLAGGEFAKPSYFNGTVYYGAVGDSIKAFPISGGKLATTPSSKTATLFTFPGATPTISANGTGNGIVWAVQNGNPAVLHAYDASNLATEFYNSNQASGARDQFSGNKFIVPVIANGKVLVGTPNSLAVFGLL
ncbi:MAG TPA: hypothetical protein VKQ28_08115 [Candidatus Acidoferrum sp.]|nr:hypothetical protein [Candidatus Acidoferrum sp.]